MTITENKLGPHYFVRMTPPPLLVSEQVGRTAQAGRDGSTYWLLGQRGTPFQITTFIEQFSLSQAMQTYRDYIKLQAEGPQDLRFAGQNFGDQKFKVLGVRPAGAGGMRAIAFGRGGVSGGIAFAVLECVWTLEARANPAPVTS